MPEVICKKVVAIEYPRQNETIASNSYTFHIVAMPGAKKVEVSIDDSVWEPCRQSGDSFFYDWFSYAPGEHEIVARVHLSDGHYHTSEHRFINVELENDGREQNAGERRTSPRRRTQPVLARPDVHKHMANKYVVTVPNHPGVMRDLTQLLSQEGVNIDSLLMETTGDVASLRFLLEKENGLRHTLEGEGYHVVEDKVFRVDLPNRPGELDQLTRKLAEQEIGIRYMYGTSHGRTTKVVFSVDRPEDALGIVKEFEKGRCTVEA
jgi:hypothetical protein